MRKIIHIDADCFFAAVEMRENPRLVNRPIAVGGAADKRGVIATCNYPARAFGVRSAMATAYAKKLCPALLVIRPRFELYRAVSQQMRQILRQYSEIIEPLSLDEAYLDVTGSAHFSGSATRIAADIRRQIKDQLGLCVSAGVAPNKLLAKIASDWRKPDGLFVIRPEEVLDFVAELPVNRLYGVGKVTASKLQRLGIQTAGDLRERDLLELTRLFGRFGEQLWQFSRGIDERPLETASKRQSLSVETTFAKDLPDIESCLAELPALLAELERRLQKLGEYRMDKPFVKVKFCDFNQTTLEQSGARADLAGFAALLKRAYARAAKPVRLLGIGVKLREIGGAGEQLLLFAG